MAALVLLLAGCAESTGPGINDPFEAANRRVHENNKRMDRAMIRPASTTYAETVPPGMQESIANFRTNLATPGMVVNDLLQFRGEDALVNTYRFVVNTVVGLGGLVDVAAIHGVPVRETDFGATLHFWQVPQGAYLELPVIGPSTQRDLAGRVGDFFLDPMRYVLPSPERYAGTAAGALDRLGKRGRYSGTLDSVLYDSADSYAQTRTTYLQNRRYELGDDQGTLDPYEDPYGTSEGYTDPYIDPYTQ